MARSLSPHRVQKLFAAENHAAAAHQKFQQPELRGGQLQQIAIETSLATASIHFHAAGFKKPERASPANGTAVLCGQ